MGGPVVEGIAPELACGAEIVGRYSGHDRRKSVFIEIKKLFMGPDIGAVRRNENRNITDNADAFFMGIVFQFVPLFKENVLKKTVVVHRILQFFMSGGFDGRRRKFRCV